MKQYNIPLGGYKPVEGVIYLLENDLNQINKIPFLENYEGYAIITIGPIYLDTNIDIEKIIKNNPIITNEDHTIFIVNCGHTDLSDKSLVVSQSLELEKVHYEDSLNNYFSDREVKDLKVQKEYKDLHNELKKYCYKEL
jgi:hypothetical protein